MIQFLTHNFITIINNPPGRNIGSGETFRVRFNSTIRSLEKCSLSRDIVRDKLEKMAVLPPTLPFPQQMNGDTMLVNFLDVYFQ